MGRENRFKNLQTRLNGQTNSYKFQISQFWFTVKDRSIPREWNAQGGGKSIMPMICSIHALLQLRVAHI